MSSGKIDFYGKDLRVYKSCLHTHSTVSDGRFSPEEVIRMYAEKGYDVLAFTDHRRYNPVDEYDPRTMRLLSGIELHPEGPFGRAWHLLTLGVREGDVPGDTAGMTAQQVIDAAKRAGGIVFAAHPYWCGFQHEHVSSLAGISGIEVWNTSCRYIGKAYNMQIWDDLLMRGHRLGALAVDDTHRAEECFFGWTMICAPDDSESSLLSALDSGSFYSTQGPEFYRLNWKDGVLEAEFSPCTEVIIVSSSCYGHCVRRQEEPGSPVSSLRVELPRALAEPQNLKYLRIQLRDREGRYAWSMPVYLQ
ncbi:MAG: CehA/McbA family metallohydrolase [Lentisphaeria bacterium]|nr:CehA/McbA family metallohydrolase [Lentisphaeria bacterium]